MALTCILVALIFVAPLAAFPQQPLPPPPCAVACAWCERFVAPKLAEINRHCPNCSCAALNSTCPAPKGPARFCLQGTAQDAKGCSSNNCDFAPYRLQALRKVVQDCPKTCPGGFQLDPKSGRPLCECMCPLERTPPMERTQRCAQTCRGFTFSLLFNRASGCTECFCGQKLPVQNCLPFACPLYCPLGYDLGPNGCPLCRCKEPASCPPAPKCTSTCLAGPQRDSFTGCVTNCKCADEEFHCPLIGCNQDCGLHKFETVVKGKCVIACKCTCSPLTCPEQSRFCVEPELDEFSCPTCGCKRYEQEEEQKPKVCRPPGTEGEFICDLKCPSGMRPFDSQADCELCACCPTLSTQCPDLQCDQYAVNAFGCPTCECQTKTDVPEVIEDVPEPQPQNEVEIDVSPEEEKPTDDQEAVVPFPYHPMKPEVPAELFQENAPNRHPETRVHLSLTKDGSTKELAPELLQRENEPFEGPQVEPSNQDKPLTKQNPEVSALLNNLLEENPTNPDADNDQLFKTSE